MSTLNPKNGGPARAQRKRVAWGEEDGAKLLPTKGVPQLLG